MRSSQGGLLGPCDPRNASRALRAAAAKGGLPHAGLPPLRHSAASVMLTHCVPPQVVAEILGNPSIADTGDIYATSSLTSPARRCRRSATPSRVLTEGDDVKRRIIR
jgi:integrase